MKRIIFTLFVTFSLLATAQVGINTDAPNATLEVKGDAATATTVDGMMIPSLTAAQLAAKDTYYTDDQDGAVVYVKGGAGTTAKTERVNGAGFYYYDKSLSLWLGVGSTTSGYKKVIVHTGTTNPTSAADIYGTATDIDVVMDATNTATGAHDFFLPDPATYKYRTVMIINCKTTASDNNGGTYVYGPVYGAGAPLDTPIGTGYAINEGRSAYFYSDGTKWFVIQSL